MKSNFMRRWLVPLSCSMATGLCLLLLWSLQLSAQAVPAQTTNNPAPAALSNRQLNVDPLPPGCIHGTPAGEDPPICCMSGLVFVNGQPVSGAEVSISDAQGVVAQVQTYLHSEADTEPYYQVDLTHLTRPVTVSQEITIVARYGELTSQLFHYTVRRGGQQLNLVIYQPGALAATGATKGQAPLGQFNRPLGVAVDSQGNIYVTDAQNARIQKFSTDNKVRAWGEQGTLPQQFGTLSKGIAVDQRNDIVYVVDRANERIARYTASGDLLSPLGPPAARPNAFANYALQNVAVDANGTVYVTTLGSGLYRFSADGTWQPWQPDSPISWPDGGSLALAPDGRVYGANSTLNGIFRFDNGRPITLTVSPSNLPVYGPTSIAFDTAGAMYVMFYQQITSAPTLFKFTVQGDTLSQDTAWHWQPPATLGHAAGLAIHGERIYLAGDLDNYVYIFGIDGSDKGKLGMGVPNPGQIIDPLSVAISPSDGSPYVADYESHRILQISPTTNVVTASWDSTALLLTATKPTLLPHGLAFDKAGHLFMVDKYSTLTRFTRDAQGLHVDGSWGGQGEFAAPYAVAIDQKDYIYVADQSNNRVKIVKIINDVMQTVTVFSNVTATDTLQLPQSIAIDDHDPQAVTGYVVDAHACTEGAQRLFKFTLANDVIQNVTAWGANHWGDATLPQVCPTAVDVDEAGNLYLLDQGRIIRKFNPAGQLIPTAGFTASDGAGPNQLGGGTDLAVAKDGVVYVTDPNNLRVQRFQPISIGDPVASIVQISTDTVASGQSFVVAAAGQVGGDASQIDSYEWSTDDGFLLTSLAPTVNISTALTPTLSTQLGPGAHRLRLRVRDSQGPWSAYTSITVHVRAVPPQPLPQCPAGESWTFLLYLDADNTNDGPQLARAFDQSIARLGGLDNPCVQLAIQRDNPPGIGESGTERWQRLAGQSLSKLPNIPEAQMDMTETLISFINWGQKMTPADHYYLAIADHGDGARGIAWDYTSDPNGNAYLTPAALRNALADDRVSPIDILHLDACSLGLFDIAYELRDRVNYVITSQYLGWDFFIYDEYAKLAADDPAQLAKGIVERYAALAEHDQLPYTLAAWNLSRIEPLKNGLSGLATLLYGHLVDNSDQARRQALLAVRNASQTFDSNRDALNTKEDAYVDLLDWVTHLRDANINDTITMSATSIIHELQRNDGVILAKRASLTPLPLDLAHGALISLAHANGISLYYPLEGTLHVPAVSASLAASGGYTYTQVFADYVDNKVFDFPQTSRWDEFLTTAYGAPAGVPLEPPSPPPGPLISTEASQKVYLPLIRR